MNGYDGCPFMCKKSYKFVTSFLTLPNLYVRIKKMTSQMRIEI